MFPSRLRTLAWLLPLAAPTLVLAQGSSTVAGPAHPRSAHAVAVPSAQAFRRAGQLTLDGELGEPAWAAATPVTELRQTDPREGQPASQRTEVRFLFDDEALWVGARMYDSLGARGVTSRLVRRDQDMESDWFHVVLDTYHDHLSRAFFQVNPAGVKYDAIGIAGSNPDPSWDPVWEVATRIDSAGWTAEMRIPYSQLRFSGDSAQIWGLQVRRWVQRLNEQDEWSFWTKQEAGGPARFGHLEGVRIAGRPRHLELLPYAVSRARYVDAKTGDPFHDGSEMDYRVGADVKYLLTSNLTLDATFNPDFGQVEVDPAVVNLSAFETFYPERRPFFIEGSGLFDFGSFNCFFCSNVSSLDAFYSRRIGRAPHLAGWVRDNSDYADIPESSTILGAAKITGRTGSYSVGMLDAVTRRERAEYVSGDDPRVSREVEPLSNYFVGRVKRDYRGGDVVIGGIATSTLRSLGDSLAATRMSRHAEVLGPDWVVQWSQKRYSFMGSALLSNVVGDSAAIRRAQYGSARYFQRPDRKAGTNGLFSDRLDPAATALRGYGLYSRLAKDAGTWLWEGAVNLRSPGFETNDLSFLTRADYVWHNANIAYNRTTPTRWFRNLFASVGGQQQLNYDGDLTDRQYQAYVGGDLPNFWNANTFYIYHPTVFDDGLTRGGPVVKKAGYHYAQATVRTDARRPVVVETRVNSSTNLREHLGRDFAATTTVRFKPRSNVSISLGPSYTLDHSPNQYVETIDTSAAPGFYGERYVFSSIVQRIVSMNTRLNVTFTPGLTLELFAQPFIASGDYFDFKEFAAPRTQRKLVYGRDLGTITPVRTAAGADSAYVVTDGRGASPFSFENPDFNSRSLRGNAVLRWEYRPGSTLFFVWTQERSADAPTGVGDFALDRDRRALFRAHPDNVFQVKVNYWLGR
ncbi:MAG: DUF5916 domain-containing protein [Gemmatimonadaceae bacterium]